MRNYLDMRKAILALGLLALISSCKKKEYTCYCEDVQNNVVFKKTLSGLTYSEFQTYCYQAEVSNHQASNSVTCKVLDKAPEEMEEK
jgi:hypothetical protein